jgi:hypothetical protein
MHTPRCHDIPGYLETIIAPLPGEQTTLGGPGGAIATGVSCLRTRCLMVAHTEAKAQWVTLTYPGAKNVFISCRAGSTRILLSDRIEDVLVPNNIAIAVWNEDLPAAYKPGRAT